jgi:hypothetical protein
MNLSMTRGLAPMTSVTIDMSGRVAPARPPLPPKQGGSPTECSRAT